MVILEMILTEREKMSVDSKTCEHSIGFMTITLRVGDHVICRAPDDSEKVGRITKTDGVSVEVNLPPFGLLWYASETVTATQDTIEEATCADCGEALNRPYEEQVCSKCHEKALMAVEAGD